MKIQTLSVVIGGKACNAKCPFCVSRMTGFSNLENKITPNYNNFDTTLKFAESSGVTTVLLTGKGEPLLYPEQISECLSKLQNSNIAFKELQTNGLLIQKLKEDEENNYLNLFYNKGLRTISLSVVHWLDEKNAEIYTPNKTYPSLIKTIKILHDIGYSVRLSVIMVKGYIDNYDAIDGIINFARENKVEQLTLRPINSPQNSKDTEATTYVNNHYISDIINFRNYIRDIGTELLKLAHGAIVYDVKGQNVCFSTCLTESTNTDDIRQIIYFLNDGSLRYSWQYEGARLL